MPREWPGPPRKDHGTGRAVAPGKLQKQSRKHPGHRESPQLPTRCLAGGECLVYTDGFEKNPESDTEEHLIVHTAEKSNLQRPCLSLLDP